MRGGKLAFGGCKVIDAVIIEDSELARFELEHQLKAHPQIRIVGQAADVDGGVALIDREAPGLVFLDVDLPGGNAFDLLARLERVPQIVFTTAHQQFALQAFDVSTTIDYLLKPIEPDRLARAIGKLDLEPERVAIARSPRRPDLREGWRPLLAGQAAGGSLDRGRRQLQPPVFRGAFANGVPGPGCDRSATGSGDVFPSQPQPLGQPWLCRENRALA